MADSHKTVSETVGPIRGGKLIFKDFNNFCVLLITYLPIIKQVPQFLIKGKLFLGEGERDRGIHRQSPVKSPDIKTLK